MSRDHYVGEPDYPSPWTTSRPLEGLRDEVEARIVSLAPDVCLTPAGSSVVPIPYPITSVAGDDADYTQTVHFTGQRAMVLRSHTTRVTGDEAGTQKGMVSGTVGDICEPIGHAAQVRAEGSPVIRHLDRFYMNSRNTVGEAVFVRDTGTFDPLVDDDPLPGSLRLVGASGAPLPGPPPGADPRILLAQAPAPVTEPVPGEVPGRPPGQVIEPGPNRAPQWYRPPPPAPEPPSSPIVRYGRWGLLPLILMLGGSTPLLMYPGPDADEVELDLHRQARGLLDPFDHSYNERVAEWYHEQLEAYRAHRDANPDEDARPQPVPLPDTVRISEEERQRRCRVLPYGQLRGTCPSGMQAHHIVPDFTLRYGRRHESNRRIPNMPSLNQGPAICLHGHAAMSDTEHHEAHLVDGQLEDEGALSTPPNTLRLGRVIDLSTAAVIALRRECAPEIREGVDLAFAGVHRDQLVRSLRNPLPSGRTLEALQTGQRQNASGDL